MTHKCLDGNLSDDNLTWGDKIDRWVESDPVEYKSKENLLEGEDIDIWIGEKQNKFQFSAFNLGKGQYIVEVRKMSVEKEKNGLEPSTLERLTNKVRIEKFYRLLESFSEV